LMYLHLQSMRNFDKVKDRLVQSQTNVAKAPEVAAKATAEAGAERQSAPASSTGRRTKGAAAVAAE
ncbi:MAG: hypothetical protein OEW36_13090, partial [Hylemonella sp.]|nr:hypothetical protein [Hylemonella sp.]